MKLYKFATAGHRRIAISRSRDPSNLPRGHRWYFAGHIEVSDQPEPKPRVGFSREEMLESTKDGGLLLWPEAKPNA